MGHVGPKKIRKVYWVSVALSIIAFSAVSSASYLRAYKNLLKPALVVGFQKPIVMLTQSDWSIKQTSKEDIQALGIKNPIKIKTIYRALDFYQAGVSYKNEDIIESNTAKETDSERQVYKILSERFESLLAGNIAFEVEQVAQREVPMKKAISIEPFGAIEKNSKKLTHSYPRSLKIVNTQKKQIQVSAVKKSKFVPLLAKTQIEQPLGLEYSGLIEKFKVHEIEKIDTYIKQEAGKVFSIPLSVEHKPQSATQVSLTNNDDVGSHHLSPIENESRSNIHPMNTQIMNTHYFAQFPQLPAPQRTVSTQEYKQEYSDQSQQTTIISGMLGPVPPSLYGPQLPQQTLTEIPQERVVEHPIIPAPQPASGNQGTQSTSSASVASNESNDKELDSNDSEAVGFYGVVTEAFSGGTRAVSGAHINIVGAGQSFVTNERGEFLLSGVQIQGVLPVMITQNTYLPRRAELIAGRKMQIELLSENAAQLAALASNISRAPHDGFIFGQLYDPQGGSLSSYRVNLYRTSDGTNPLEKTIYVNDRGAPDTSLQFTTERGQFVIPAVRSDTYTLVVTDILGIDRAPHIIHVSAGEGIVKKFNLGTQEVITGKIINGTTQNAALDGALVQFMGSVAKTITDKYGRFTLGPTYIDCNDLNYLQVEKQGFYRNRTQYTCDHSNAATYYVFPAGYVDGAALDAGMKLLATDGLIVGHVPYNFSVHVQLLGVDELHPANQTRGYDFYHDRDGVINPNRNTTSENGNFIIMNGPEGLSYIQIFNKNDTISMRPVLLSPSTVNVYLQ